MVNQLARQSITPAHIFTLVADEQQPTPPRDADSHSDSALASDTRDASDASAESEGSWIDELAHALRELAHQSLGQADDERSIEEDDHGAPH